MYLAMKVLLPHCSDTPKRIVILKLILFNPILKFIFNKCRDNKIERILYIYLHILRPPPKLVRVCN